MEIFVIYDNVGGFYEVPFFAHNRQDAERSVASLARVAPDHKVCHYPDDYSLYHLGSWDYQTGYMMVKEKPEFIARLSTYIHVTQGAAVGDEIPLKSQSAKTEDAADAVDTVASV